MNLTEFFMDNYVCGENLFYDAFYTFYMENVPEAEYLVKDVEDLIEKWKKALYPNYINDLEANICFGLMSFWLFKNEYIVEEYPKFLYRCKSNKEFSSNELYRKTKELYGTKPDKNEVAWESRRDYIDSLTVKKRDKSIVFIDYDIETLLTKVSTRDEEFNNMGLNEKLYAIRNAYENIGKIDGKFIKVPFEEITSGYITSDLVNLFSKEIQCFRHGDVTMIEKRDSFSDEQKQFFVDFGLTLLSAYHRHLKLNINQSITK